MPDLLPRIVRGLSACQRVRPQTKLKGAYLKLSNLWQPQNVKPQPANVPRKRPRRSGKPQSGKPPPKQSRVKKQLRNGKPPRSEKPKSSNKSNVKCLVKIIADHSQSATNQSELLTINTRVKWNKSARARNCIEPITKTSV